MMCIIIAAQINRTEHGIRNQRHRMKLETDTRASLQSLLKEKKTLNKQASNLRREVETMKSRHIIISKILDTQEEVLNQRLTTALTRLKDRRPELFTISPQEQIGKLTGVLITAFIKWLVS